jgi:hypothetical protein
MKFMSKNHQETLVMLGLGDDKVVARQTRFVEFLNRSRPADAQILIFPTLWQTSETKTDKKRRLGVFVQENSGIKIVYAISAGGSLGVNLIPDMPPETEYHFMCGKLQNADSLGIERRQRAPALFDCVVDSEIVIAQTDFSDYNITCHYGYIDGVLSISDQLLPGTVHHRIPMINHSATIALAYPTILRKL